MSIDQLTAKAMALPLRDRVELLLRVHDSLPDEKKPDLDLDYLRGIIRRADESNPVKAAGENA